MHHGMAKEFDLLKDGEQPLYDGCTEYSKLSFLVKLYHMKVLCRVSDKAMTMIIELLHDAFKHLHTSLHLIIMQRNSSTRLYFITLKYMHVLRIVCYIGGEDANKGECKISHTFRWNKKKQKGS